MPVTQRIQCAEALGRGGDPRLGSNVDNVLEVPGLDGVKLGKYPVTVEEFRHFVDHRGYEHEEYWDDEGRAFREKDEWDAPDQWDEQLLTPNRPVVGVSWYEARAYCRWLSEQRDEAYRLPKEAEWEQAATNERGPYPWGDEEPNDELANFDQHVGAPTPVGVYPKGDGPGGHCDPAGNVWEWCENPWAAEGFREDEIREYGPPYVLRGGSWGSPAGSLRSADRDWGRASNRYVDVGFRVAVSPRAL